MCTVHSNSKKSLIGTWVSCEIKLAIEKGYKILEIFEVWNYEIEQINGNKGGLFTEYVDTFLKIKQEYSGIPEDVSDIDKYIKEYFQKEGVQLDKSKILKNPSLRQFAKLCLNSFWGKFIQRDNLSQNTVCNSPDEFHEIVFAPNVEVIDLLPINETKVYVNWKYNEEFQTDTLPHEVLTIGAFTTATARIKLFRELDKLCCTLIQTQ